jgi:chorismate mutase/prephenate dehydratase
MSAPRDSLETLRDEVARIDEALLTLLAQRLEVARRIGDVKRRAGRAVCDPAREAHVVRRAAERARALGVPEDDVRALTWRVVALTRRVQGTKVPNAPA